MPKPAAGFKFMHQLVKLVSLLVSIVDTLLEVSVIGADPTNGNGRQEPDADRAVQDDEPFRKEIRSGHFASSAVHRSRHIGKPSNEHT
jgi:hypothetical protein